MLRLQEIREILEINLTSPSGLRWKTIKGKSNMKIGDMAGSLDSKGYYAVCINYKKYRNHRVIYALYHNLELDQLPKMLDHIDRDRANNDPLNLRPATNSQNLLNKRIQRNNKSGIKGVSWCKRDCKWLNQIKINGKQKNLGRFNTIEEATKAYKEASLKYHGEFSLFANPK